MATLKQIEEFLASQPFAMAGVSRNPKKFGYTAFFELKERGMNVVPVNPYAGEINGVKAYPDIKSLPLEIRGLIIVTPKTVTAALVKEAVIKGIRQIWIQQKSEYNEVFEELKDASINYITGQCILMHYRPRNVHKFHGKLKKLFRMFPK
ncbi:MAG: CoA-binding protein [Bacteroidales bacterium]|jgi:hypothetical protein